MSQDEKTKLVLRKLAKLAVESPLSINELRVALALERLVARLTIHKKLNEKLVFKGGFVLLRAYNTHRFTRDLDALAEKISKEELLELVQVALGQDLNDALSYGIPEIHDLVDQGKYAGYRVKIPFQIGTLPTESRKLKKISRIHLDIGFGDKLTETPKQFLLNSLLGIEEPISWKVYPLENIFAEKLETLVSRGSANSRAKDLYDMVIIFESLKDRALLAKAIRETFLQRETQLPKSFSGFLQDLDLSVLRNSWEVVTFQAEEISFDKCTENLMLALRKVNNILLL